MPLRCPWWTSPPGWGKGRQGERAWGPRTSKQKHSARPRQQLRCAEPSRQMVQQCSQAASRSHTLSEGVALTCLPIFSLLGGRRICLRPGSRRAGGDNRRRTVCRGRVFRPPPRREGARGNQCQQPRLERHGSRAHGRPALCRRKRVLPMGTPLDRGRPGGGRWRALARRQRVAAEACGDAARVRGLLRRDSARGQRGAQCAGLIIWRQRGLFWPALRQAAAAFAGGVLSRASAGAGSGAFWCGAPHGLRRHHVCGTAGGRGRAAGGASIQRRVDRCAAEGGDAGG